MLISSFPDVNKDKGVAETASLMFFCSTAGKSHEVSDDPPHEDVCASATHVTNAIQWVSQV